MNRFEKERQAVVCLNIAELFPIILFRSLGGGRGGQRKSIACGNIAIFLFQGVCKLCGTDISLFQ